MKVPEEEYRSPKQILKDLCKKYNFQLAPFNTTISLIAEKVVSKATI